MIRRALIVWAACIVAAVLWSALAFAVPARHRLRNDGRANPYRKSGASTIVSSYAGLMDGTNDYFDAGDTTTTDSLTKCTWSLWMRVGAWPASQRPIAAKWAASNLQWTFAVNATNGSITFWPATSLTTSNANWTSAASAFADATWYHLAIVYDGTQGTNANRVRVYRNGTDITDAGTHTGTHPTALPGNGTAPIKIGGWSTAVYFPGRQDEFAIFAGTAMSQAQVSEVYNAGVAAIDLSTLTLSPRPTHWWRLENNGTDSGLSPANLTATNGATYDTTVPW